MTYNEWVEKYKPIENPIRGLGTLFETYGEELNFVEKQDISTIWTLMECDDYDAITSGYHIVNLVGYYITEIPWDDNSKIILEKGE